MSRKLLAGAVASALALSPTVALAAKTHKHDHPACNACLLGGLPMGSPDNSSAKDPTTVSQPPAPSCLGTLYGGQCRGYRYVCLPPFYPKQLAYFTNSDTVEDFYEAVLVGPVFHPFRCYGD
jgi:hypothetical protein